MLNEVELLKELQRKIKRNSRALLFVEKEKRTEMTFAEKLWCAELTRQNEYLTTDEEKELHTKALKKALEWSLKVK